MPLDDFQKRVIGILMPLRSPDSTFAGGAVLQRHGFRLTDDEDLFHSDNVDVPSVAERDMEIIRRLPPEHAGKLFVDDKGGVVSDLDRILAGEVKIVEASKGGTWPSSIEIDGVLIARIIETFGWDGAGEPSYDPSPKR